MGAFADWITHLRPSWMGTKARALFGAFADIEGDKTDSETIASLTEEMPITATDPASIALALSERGLEPGPGLSTDDLRTLASAAPALNKFRGRDLGILVALYYAGLKSPVYVQQNGVRLQLTSSPNLDDLRSAVALPSWATKADLANANPAIPVSTDGRPAIVANTVPWWNFDSDMDAEGNQFTSRFGLVYPVSIVTPPDFTDPVVLARAKRIIAAWKPAKSKCMGIWVAGHSVVYGMGSKYGSGIKYGGSGSAHYSVE